jgi:hypothetical protein
VDEKTTLTVLPREDWEVSTSVEDIERGGLVDIEMVRWIAAWKTSQGAKVMV